MALAAKGTGHGFSHGLGTHPGPCLKDLLRLVREQHRVAVEGNADLIGMSLGVHQRLGVHSGRRKSRGQRGFHVIAVCGKKKMSA
jgi:hypothetical protein